MCWWRGPSLVRDWPGESEGRTFAGAVPIGLRSLWCPPWEGQGGTRISCGIAADKSARKAYSSALVRYSNSCMMVVPRPMTRQTSAPQIPLCAKVELIGSPARHDEGAVETEVSKMRFILTVKKWPPTDGRSNSDVASSPGRPNVVAIPFRISWEGREPCMSIVPEDCRCFCPQGRSIANRALVDLVPQGRPKLDDSPASRPRDPIFADG